MGLSLSSGSIGPNKTSGPNQHSQNNTSQWSVGWNCASQPHDVLGSTFVLFMANTLRRATTTAKGSTKGLNTNATSPDTRLLVVFAAFLSQHCVMLVSRPSWLPLCCLLHKRHNHCWGKPSNTLLLKCIKQTPPNRGNQTCDQDEHWTWYLIINLPAN